MENSVQVDLRVVQLLCSRLCHDLAGPAGAVHNGMELLQEFGGADDGASALIASSIGQLNNRLAFYRMAFGLGGLSGRKPAMIEARELASAFLKGGRITLDWPESEISLSGGATKLMLNMILLGADSLPRGGSLTVTLAVLEGAALRMQIMASGAGAVIKDEIIAALNLGPGAADPNTVLTAHNVHGYFLQRLAQSLGSEMDVSGSADEVKIAIQLIGS